VGSGVEGAAISRGKGLYVSVIIPCYNQGRFLKEAVDSVLSQSYGQVEVLVVDDGSTDDTAAVAARYGPRIRYLYKDNDGLSAARNTGILEATGEFVLFLDADDYLSPEMLERHVAAAHATPSGTVFYGGWRVVNLAGRVLYQEQAELGGDPVHELLKENGFAVHAATVRRSAFANVGLFDVRLKACEDWDMWLRLAAAGHEFVAVPESWAMYRRYAGSMSSDYSRMWPTGLAIIARKQPHHFQCPLCRRAVTSGIWAWRRWCLGLLYDEFMEFRSRGETRAGLTRAGLAVMRDPLLLLLSMNLLFARVRRIGGRLRRKLGTRLPRLS
jgi:glycosyltransferase involved in cell wall biosynthesis